MNRNRVLSAFIGICLAVAAAQTQVAAGAGPRWPRCKRANSVVDRHRIDGKVRSDGPAEVED